MRNIYIKLAFFSFLSLFASQELVASEFDDARHRGNMQMTAVVAAPIVLAGAVGTYWYFFRETDEQKIDKAYALMSALSPYENEFVTKTGRGDTELVLNECLAQFGITVDEISDDFLQTLDFEVRALKKLRNNLWWRSLRIKSWYVDPEVSVCEHKLYTYWCNGYYVLKFFQKHRTFFEGYQLRNFYKNLPIKKVENLKNWVLGAMCEYMYPLQEYVAMAKKDLRWVKRLHVQSGIMALYPVMVRSVIELTQSIEKSIMHIVALEEYQAEVAAKQKHYEQLAFIQAEQAKADAAREHAEAMKEQADAAHRRADAAFEANQISRNRR